MTPKSAGGRPPLSPTKERIRLVVYIDPDTKAAMDEAREDTGISEWVRRLISRETRKARRKP